MRPIVLTILTLAAGCGAQPPATPVVACNPDLPADAGSPATWAWLDAHDPAFARQVDRANARELCTCARKRAALAPGAAAAICGGA